MNVFFTSDQHYRHRNIIQYSKRPFYSIEDMDETLIQRHNDRVRPGDRVIHLGDVSLDDRVTAKVIKRLNGVHSLVPGNHDRCHSCHRGHVAWRRKYAAMGFEVLPERTEFERFDVCHFPFRGDHSRAERYLEHRPPPRGRPLLHGHVHEAWKVTVEQSSRCLMINVGVDVWGYAPVAWEELQAIASKHGS